MDLVTIALLRRHLKAAGGSSSSQISSISFDDDTKELVFGMSDGTEQRVPIPVQEYDDTEVKNLIIQLQQELFEAKVENTTLIL